MEEIRPCNECGEEFPLSNFPCRRSKNWKCKDCHNAYMAWYRDDNPAKPAKFDPSYVPIKKKKPRSKKAPVATPTSTVQTPNLQGLQSPVQVSAFSLNPSASNSNAEILRLNQEVISLKNDVAILKTHNQRLSDAINDIYQKMSSPSVSSSTEETSRPYTEGDYVDLDSIQWTQTAEDEDITPDFNYDLITSLTNDVDSLKEKLNVIDTRTLKVPDQITAQLESELPKIITQVVTQVRTTIDEIVGEVSASLQEDLHSKVDENILLLKETYTADCDKINEEFKKRLSEEDGVISKDLNEIRDKIAYLENVFDANKDIVDGIQYLGELIDNLYAYLFMGPTSRLELVKGSPTSLPIYSGILTNPISYKNITYPYIEGTRP